MFFLKYDSFEVSFINLDLILVLSTPIWMFMGYLLALGIMWLDNYLDK